MKTNGASLTRLAIWRHVITMLLAVLPNIARAQSGGTTTVTAPASGAQWQRGTMQTIRWTSTGTVSDVEIQLRDSGGNYTVIAQAVANSGSYSWQIPANGVVGTCNIRVSDVKNWGSIYDLSDNFSLTNGGTGGSIAADVYDVSATRMAAVDLNAIQLFGMPNWAFKDQKKPVDANPATFAGWGYGQYALIAYAWDMEIAETSNGFTLNQPTTTIRLDAWSRRPLTVDVYYAGGTVKYPGATVLLDSHDGDQGIWNQRASGTTDANGHWAVQGWPTTKTGEQYRIRVNNSSGTQVGVYDNVTLANSSAGSRYSITTTEAIPKGSGNISVDVYSSSGVRLAAGDMNAVLVFRRSDGGEVARNEPPSANPVTCSSISYGTYWADVYCWDMLAQRSPNFSHAAATTSVTVPTYPRRPLKVTAYYSGTTNPYPGAIVYLDSYNAYRASHGGQAWTQRAIGTTGGDGSYTFSAWPTTLSADGEKYRIRIQNVDGTQVAIMDNITLSNDVSGGNYTVTTSQLSSPYITGFKVPTGTHQRGEQVEVSVTVKNSSDAARSFWVGLSLANEKAAWPSWPAYWYDIKPQETDVLQPAQEQTLTFSFNLHDNLWPGKYYAVAKIWSGFDAETYRMVGPEFDSTLNYIAWQDPQKPADGTGLPAFSLGAYTFAPDTFLGQVQYAILKDMYQVPTLENLYANGQKPLLYISTGIGDKEWRMFGIPLKAGVNGTVLIDLADLLGVTPEGRDGDGWVTVWVDVDASLGLTGPGLPVDFGVVPQEFDISERALADYRKYVSGRFFSVNTPAWTFTVLECSQGSGCEWFRLNWAAQTPISVDVVGASGNLVSVEVNRRLLVEAIQQAVPGAGGLVGLRADMIQRFVNIGDVIRPATTDDGDWPVYDGQWVAPLKIAPPNSTDRFAHFFVIDVPSGVSRLRFVTDNVGQSEIGNCDLYVQYGGRPSLSDSNISNYRAGSWRAGNSETVTIDNPVPGQWFAMLPAWPAYEQVQFAAILESSGAPVVTVSSIDSDASEPGYNTGRVRLSRAGSVSSSLTVNVNKSGSATEGVDYSVLPNSVTFSAGQSTADLEIVPVDDAIVEGDESVVITVTSGTGYTVGSSGSATVIIADNDVTDLQRPTAVAGGGGVSVGGGNSSTFTVTYTDNVAINRASIDSSDVRVTGPNEYSQMAALVSIDQAGNGTPRLASYRITAPGGAWDYADNGTYALTMRPNQVTDTSGNSVLEGTLTTFAVNVPGTGPTIAEIADAVTPSRAGSPYTGPVPTVSGAPPITWSLVNGPSGMTINETTGIVSWANPTPPGTSYLVTIRATNAQGFDEVSWHVSVPGESNSAPGTPTLGSPANGAVNQSLTPTLQASAFADQDQDTHSNSEWQVDNNSDFSSPEWDSGESYAAGTQAVVPAGQLTEGTTYYWRVRYRDNRASWSAWSSSLSFTTEGGGNTGVSAGLVGYWPLDGNANDASGNGHNGAVAGGVSFVSGAVGQAAQLNGTSGYIRIPDVATTPANRRSVCVWVKQDTIQRMTQEILSNHANPADCEYLIRSANDGKYDFLWTIGGNLYDGSRGGAGGDDSVGLIEPIPGQWDFLVLTYDGATIRFYGNGSLVRSIVATGNIANAPQDLFIGSYAWATTYGVGPTNPFKGLVDDVRIYDRALSLSEVQELYAQGSTPTYQLELPFDPATQETIVATGNGRHITEAQTQSAAAFDGQMYYSICTDGSASPAKIYRFDPASGSNSVVLSAAADQFWSLRVMQGVLWVSHTDGRLWSSANGEDFTLVAGTPFSASNSVTAMEEFNGKMYFATKAGKIYESAAGSAFVEKKTITAGKPIYALTSWKGYLYGANTEDYSYAAKIFRSADGSTWTILGTYNTYCFYGFVAAPDYLYLASVEDAGGPSLAVRATSDGVNWTRIFYTDTEGKGINGTPAYYAQTGRAYFLSGWSDGARLFPVAGGIMESRVMLPHYYTSIVELGGRLFGIGVPSNTDRSHFVISVLGNYATAQSTGQTYQLQLPFDPVTQDALVATGGGYHYAEPQSQSAVAFGGQLYYSIHTDGSAAPAKIYRYDPAAGSNTVAMSVAADQFWSLRVLKGVLWVSHTDGRVWKSTNGAAFTLVVATPFSESNSVTAMEEFNGKMYFATRTGKIYESSDGSAFLEKATVAAGHAISTLAAWKGYLYAADYENYSYSAKLFRSSDGVNWTVLGTYPTYGFCNLLGTPDFLYVSSVENADWASFAVRATADGVNWTQIFFTNSEGKNEVGTATYYAPTGRGYFLSSWFDGSRLFPVAGGAMESRVLLSRYYFSIVEVGGRLYGIGAPTPSDMTHFVVAVLGDYSAPSSSGAPLITTPGSNQSVIVGERVTLGVTVDGIGPFAFQWRKDGADILDATSATYVIASAQLADSGIYSVVVSNPACSAVSESYVVTVSFVPENDDFADASVLNGPAVLWVGSNIGATKEVGEPNHAGDIGGHSVWLKWTAPETGSVSLDLTGSNFDTLLAIYTGSSLSTLNAVASDDDSASSEFSALTFTAVAGTTYSIAVDGYNGETGYLWLNLTLTAKAAPSIVAAPAGPTVTVGGSAGFAVAVSGTAPFTYRWQVSIDGGATWSNLTDAGGYSGTTTANLAISSATAAMNGCQYRCVITNAAGSAVSDPAILSVGSTYGGTTTYCPIGGAIGTSSAIQQDQFLGARFAIGSASRIVSVTGEFSHTTGSLFVAIVPLDSLTSLPAGIPSERIAFGAGEVAAYTTFTLPPNSSGVFTVPLGFDVGPGVYGVVFGTGLYGTSGGGGMLRYADVAGSTGFFWSSSNSFRWLDAVAEQHKIGISIEAKNIDLERGLVAYWPFDGTGNDASGNGHNGTIVGGVSFVAGAVGQAAELDGTSGYIRIPDFTTTPANRRSVCLWVKQDTVRRTTQEILSNHDNPATCEYLIRSAADGSYDFLCSIGGNMYDGSRGGAGGDDSVGLVNPVPGEWDFLVLTYDGATICFYDNGSLVRTISASGDIVNAPWNLCVGVYAWNQTSNHFKGLVDDLRIYNRSLSAIEIRELYYRGRPKLWSVAANGRFAGAGNDGLLWSNITTGETAIWLMNGTTCTAGASFAPGVDWTVAGTGDFDGDGRTDLLWRNTATGGVVIWFMNGTTLASSKWIYDSGTAWVPYKVADFNGDGKTDILWHNSVTGDYAFWLMNGTGELLGASGFAVAAGWGIVQVADFNGDGKADLMWRNSSSGGIVLWLMNGTAIVSSPWIYDSGLTWSPTHIADFNGDGKADILWENVDGSKAFWLMNPGGELAGASGFSVASGWQVALTADFNGDGKADILWRNSSTGGVVMWLMTGTATTSTPWIYNSGPSWTPVRAADFNGDGKADILWQNTDGSLAIWLMDGATSIGGAGIY